MGVTRGEQRLEPGAFATDLESASNVLVYSPSIGGLSSASAIPAFLPDGTDMSSVSLTAVTYRKSADEWLGVWQREVGAVPGRCSLVGVGDDERSAAATATATAGSATPEPVSYSIQAVHPEDLTGLGIALSEPLSSASGAGLRSVLSYDSVTALIQYVDTQRTFRFLHVLTGRVRASGSLGIFYLDPAAHEDRTVATLAALFDAVVERDDDGEWVVRQP